MVPFKEMSYYIVYYQESKTNLKSGKFSFVVK